MQLQVDGVRLACEVVGTGDWPWVVFVHGFPFSRATWQREAQALAASYRVLTFDLRGLGESELGPAPQPLESYVDDLFALMDGLGIDRAALVGLSMGGYISLRAVQRAEERFWALALCDTRAEADSDEGKLGRAAGIRLLHAGGREEFLRGFLPKLLKRPESDTGRWLMDLMRANAPLAMANALAAMQGRTETTAALATFTLPTLVVVGRDDTLTPLPLAQGMAQRIPGAELAILEDAGHVANLEAPAAFDRALGGFLARVAPR